MRQDWQTAFFRQARSDYDTLQILGQSRASFCQRLHYLQMTTEKLAKGFATAPNGPQPLKNHHGYKQFIQQIKRRPELQRLVPGGPGQVSYYVDALLPYAELIENLAPANTSSGPNPEYPWQTPQGVVAPVDYQFSDLKFNLRGMVNMIKFLDRCFEIVAES